MKKAELIQQLKKNYTAFTDYVGSFNQTDFEYAAAEKWSAGQQLEHLVLSVRPVALALQLPQILLKLFIGKANRKSYDYDELVSKYLHSINNGGKASKPFVPKKVSFVNQQKLVAALNKQVNKLCMLIDKLSEEELDMLVLPHPLIGKVTLREMLYFSIYHVTHHQQSIKNSLANR